GNMYSREATQDMDWRTRQLGERDVKFSNLVSILVARVLHIGIHNERIARDYVVGGKLQVAVFKLRIAQPKTKRIQRLALEVAISAVCHCVVFKRRQLIHARVEGHRQTSRWVVRARDGFRNGCSTFLT